MVLLDTAPLLWYYEDSRRLSQPARTAIEDTANQKFVSAASYWEIAIKTGKRALALKEPFVDFIQHAIHDNGFEILPIMPSHAELVRTLAFFHKDPFDRILVAQAIVEGMKLVSPVQELDQYGVERVW
jgi:PIN domain nuclease of toxin-antitoxin system